jgi:hypothetical protein
LYLPLTIVLTKCPKEIFRRTARRTIVRGRYNRR